MKNKKLLSGSSQVRSFIKKVSKVARKIKSVFRLLTSRSFLARIWNNFIFHITSSPIFSTIGASAILCVLLAWFRPFSVSALWISIITVLFFGLVCGSAYWAKKKSNRLTVIKLKKDQIALIYFGEEAEIYHGPFLRKEKPSCVRKVQLPRGWGTEIRDYDEKTVEIQVNVDLEGGVISSGAVIYILIKFEFSGPFQAVDLERVLTREDINTNLPAVFKLFVEEFFRNTRTRFEGIEVNIRKKWEGKLTPGKLKSEILRDVEFPKQLFPNVRGTKIKIKKVKFNSEREM